MGKPPSPACLISRQAKEASLMAIVLIVVVAVAVHFNYTKIIIATTTTTTTTVCFLSLFRANDVDSNAS